MLSKIEFSNFKVLKKATLPLSQLTLLIGPNGSGKSTAVEALTHFMASATAQAPFDSVGSRAHASALVHFAPPYEGWAFGRQWAPGQGAVNPTWQGTGPQRDRPDLAPLRRVRVYSLIPEHLVSDWRLEPNVELSSDGSGLPAVLDRLRDEAPERFEALNATLQAWIPEFDRILFETPSRGMRGFKLRKTVGGHAIPARDLSQGTVLALAILTIAYLPEPPPILCFEEPDRGLHPRLMRDVRDALYRLSHPESFGETRDPVQVIATTHSPYLLDLFREHPEEVVIADKLEDGFADFERLSDRDDVEEILGDSTLGDAWYTGVLGGVPAR